MAKKKVVENPFLKYRNPDPRCTYPFDVDMCEACTFYIFKVDVCPTRDLADGECPKCKYWKKDKKGG